MTVQGIDHIELIVRDLEESIDFFQKLGFELVTRTTHHEGSVELKLPGPDQPLFELHQVSGEENIGINHIAFRVEDATAAYQELQSEGVSSAQVPNYVPSTGRTTVNLRDPDGWRLQLVDEKRATPEE